MKLRDPIGQSSRKKGQFEIYQQIAVVKTLRVDEIAKREQIAWKERAMLE